MERAPASGRGADRSAGRRAARPRLTCPSRPRHRRGGGRRAGRVVLRHPPAAARPAVRQIDTRGHSREEDRDLFLPPRGLLLLGGLQLLRRRHLPQAGRHPPRARGSSCPRRSSRAGPPRWWCTATGRASGCRCPRAGRCSPCSGARARASAPGATATSTPSCSTPPMDEGAEVITGGGDERRATRTTGRPVIGYRTRSAGHGPARGDDRGRLRRLRRGRQPQSRDGPGLRPAVRRASDG